MLHFSLDSLAATTFHWQTALSLALASKLAYEGRVTVDQTARGWGLEDLEFVQRDDTQCFCAASPAAVLIAFRGTESLGDWLINLNLVASNQPYGIVHQGFQHGFVAVRRPLERRLARFPDRPVLLTGHSLGGALATIAAAEFQHAYQVQGVYTFGQPAVGRGPFISFMTDHYGDRFFRFVNDHDVVPRVPPNFRHVGRLFHFDARGDVRTARRSVTSVGAEAEGPATMSTAEFDRFRGQLLEYRAQQRAAAVTEPLAAPALESRFLSIRDHQVDAYIARIAAHID